jgi:hypothetical protein
MPRRFASVRVFGDNLKPRRMREEGTVMFNRVNYRVSEHASSKYLNSVSVQFKLSAVHNIATFVDIATCSFLSCSVAAATRLRMRMERSAKSSAVLRVQENRIWR